MPWLPLTFKFLNPRVHNEWSDTAGERSNTAAARSSNYAVLAVVFLFVRLIYLIWLSPWNLLGDEAYYWAQGQHLALSYAEKGPLLAWMLWLSGAIFGQHEWVVRLPVALASGVAAWGVARLTHSVLGGTSRAAMLSLVLFILTPAMVANGQICTQDGILIPWFIALAWIGWRMVLAWEEDRSAWVSTLLFYLLLGAGVLLKQSILLSLSAFIVYALVRRRQIVWRRSLFWQHTTGFLVSIIACAPLLIWDAQHNWPLVRHTLEHLGAAEGGFASRAHGNPATWLANTLGGLLGAGGPALALMTWASIVAIRRRHADDARWRGELWLLCTAWPTILFFIGLSVTKPVVPSWPLPSLVTLIPLAAVFLDERLPAPRFVALRWVWRSTVFYGACALVLLSFPTLLRRLPYAGPMLQSKVLHKFTGQPASADAVATVAAAHPSVRGVITDHYQHASLLSFYLPRRWTVTCAGSLLGTRLSNFDEWTDTSLYGPTLRGNDLLLIRGTKEQWGAAMKFTSIEAAGDGYWIGSNYGGPNKTGQSSEVYGHE